MHASLTRLGAFALALASFAALGGVARAGYAEGELLFTFQDPAIVESSGVASSSATDAVLFTHNDSGDSARFFAVGPAGQTLAAYSVRGALASDWEDMARGPGSNGAPALFLGDIGDNSRMRAVVTVYEVPEPAVDVNATGVRADVSPAATHLLIYEDGPHNAETLLVDPSSGRLAIVTKDNSGRSGVYVAGDPLLPGLPRLLHRVATIAFGDLASVPEVPGMLTTTGGDIAPDGSRFVVRTYFEAFEWTLAGGDLAAAVARAPLRLLLPYTQQGEAIAYTQDGRSLVTTSEGSGAPVYLMRAAA